MPWQLIYTSAARGLTPGQSGYCTVARSRDLREALIPRLEKFSYYTLETATNPTICAHRIVELRGVHYHVLTRIVDAGHDFTNRRKFLAHHLVFEPNELAAAPSPALIFLKWNGWRDDWSEDPSWIPDIKPFPIAQETPSAWEKLTGSAQNAKALVQTRGWITGDDQERKLFLNALEESLRAHDKRWEISFTNCFQPGDDPVDFRLCAVWPETPGYEKALQLGVEPSRLRELRPEKFREVVAAAQGPSTPEPPPLKSEPKTNTFWPPLTAAAAVLALASAIYFRKRPEVTIATPTPLLVSHGPSQTSPPDSLAQLDALFPATPTWLATEEFAELGPAPELERIFRMLRDSELFGKDIRANLQGAPAAVDARPPQNLLAFSNQFGVAKLQLAGNTVSLKSNARGSIVLELDSTGRYLLVSRSEPFELSSAFLSINTNTQTVTISAPLEMRLRIITPPKGTQWSLRPQQDFLKEIEDDFGFAASPIFDFPAIRSQLKQALHEKEKRIGALKKELAELRAEEKKQLTESQDATDLKRKERLAALKLAEPRWEDELKAWHDKAARVPNEFEAIRNFSLFLADRAKSSEVIRFTGEVP